MVGWDVRQWDLIGIKVWIRDTIVKAHQGTCLDPCEPMRSKEMVAQKRLDQTNLQQLLLTQDMRASYLRIEYVALIHGSDPQ